MDLFYWIGLIVTVWFISFVIFVFIADTDLITFLYRIFGKQPNTEYHGKVVWITGASGGIGEAVAKELAKNGTKIVISARRKEELERVKRECLRAFSRSESDILVLPLDVTDLGAHEPSLKKILMHFGKLDILVSNAGQMQRGVFTEVDIEVDKYIFDLNVFSVVNMNRMVVRYFFENGGGQLTVVSSIGGRCSFPYVATYTASKHALHGYFDSLRMETHGRNINITTICTGAVDTALVPNSLGCKLGQKGDPNMPTLFSAKMGAQHCAKLILVAIANGLQESWIAVLPGIPTFYMFKYFPLLVQLLNKLAGAKIAEIFKPAPLNTLE